VGGISDNGFKQNAKVQLRNRFCVLNVFGVENSHLS
jgi:hypothetical protein